MYFSWSCMLVFLYKKPRQGQHVGSEIKKNIKLFGKDTIKLQIKVIGSSGKSFYGFVRPGVCKPYINSAHHLKKTYFFEARDVFDLKTRGNKPRHLKISALLGSKESVIGKAVYSAMYLLY